MSSSLLPTESIFTRYFPFTAMHRVLGTCSLARERWRGPTAILRNAPYRSGSLEWIRSRCLTGRILSA